MEKEASAFWKQTSRSLFALFPISWGVKTSSSRVLRWQACFSAHWSIAVCLVSVARVSRDSPRSSEVSPSCAEGASRGGAAPANGCWMVLLFFLASSLEIVIPVTWDLLVDWLVFPHPHTAVTVLHGCISVRRELCTPCSILVLTAQSKQRSNSLCGVPDLRWLVNSWIFKILLVWTAVLCGTLLNNSTWMVLNASSFFTLAKKACFSADTYRVIIIADHT